MKIHPFCHLVHSFKYLPCFCRVVIFLGWILHQPRGLAILASCHWALPLSQRGEILYNLSLTHATHLRWYPLFSTFTSIRLLSGYLLVSRSKRPLAGTLLVVHKGAGKSLTIRQLTGPISLDYRSVTSGMDRFSYSRALLPRVLSVNPDLILSF